MDVAHRRALAATHLCVAVGNMEAAIALLAPEAIKERSSLVSLREDIVNAMLDAEALASRLV